MFVRTQRSGPGPSEPGCGSRQSGWCPSPPRYLVALGQLKQRQGHSQLVVKVPLALAHPEPLPQDLGDHFLGGGLAHAAGNAHRCHGELGLVGFRQGLDGFQGIPHQDLGELRRQGPLRQAAGGPRLIGGGDEVVPVEPLAPERHKQVSRLHPAVVRGDAPDHVAQRLPGPAIGSPAVSGGLRQRHRLHALTRAFRAIAR